MFNNPASTDLKDALGKLALAVGMNSLQRLTSELDPNVMLEKSSQILREEFRAAFLEVLGDVQSDTVQELLDRLFERLDDSEVIAAIAESLAKSLATWFQENPDGLISAIVEYIDMDELTSMVADKVAERIQLGS